MSHQLGQNAVNRVRMEEGDLESEETLPRLLVDQLDTALGELVDRGPDVSDLVGNVVHPGPPLGQKFANRRLLTQGREQLDPALSELQGGGLDALLGNSLAMLEPGAKDLFVGRHGLVEVLDRDAQVMDPARLHAGDATRPTRRGG
jgi:hypothetical protein